MVKWLFFDIGSTIIDESRCDEHRLQKLLEQPDAPSREVLEQTMKELAQKNKHPYRDAAKRFALETSPWPGHLEKPFSEVDQVLDELKRKYRLGIIANQNPGTEERLAAWGLRQYFDVIIASAEAGVAKPDPEIFELALHRADCKPAEAVMIGDRLDNDIFPAASHGMKTIWLRQGTFQDGDPALMGVEPTFVVTGLRALLEIL